MATTKAVRLPKKRGLTGPLSLFRGKVRDLPVSVTLTPRHHRLSKAAMARLGLTRSDLFGLLLEKYAEVVELPHHLPTVGDDDV